MLRPILPLLALISTLPLLAQNLVPNPSFEEKTDCPEFHGVVEQCLHWGAYRATPDYFHHCSQGCCAYNNSWGYQEPHSGEAFIGVITYSVSGSNPELIREWGGVQLLSPLLVGEKYYISLYVSPAWEPVGMNIATSKVGALLTTYQNQDPLSEMPLPNISHIHTDEIVSDTTVWTKISGSFIADSAYQYLMIGNFYDDIYTDTLNFPTTSPFNARAIAYVDDICVSTDSLYAHNWTSLSVNEHRKEVVTLYPNPAGEFVTITAGSRIQNAILCNAQGEIVLSKPNINREAFTMSIEHLPQGVYLVRIETEMYTHTKKIIIN